MLITSVILYRAFSRFGYGTYCKSFSNAEWPVHLKVLHIIFRLDPFFLFHVQYPTTCGPYPIKYIRDLTTGFDSSQPDKKAVSPHLLSSDTRYSKYRPVWVAILNLRYFFTGNFQFRDIYPKCDILRISQWFSACTWVWRDEMLAIKQYKRYCENILLRNILQNKISQLWYQKLQYHASLLLSTGGLEMSVGGWVYRLR